MDYIIHLLVLIGIFSILGISLNLVVGFTGLLSVTQAAFHGMGAYAVALMMRAWGMNFFLALPIAVVFTMLISALIGTVLSKFKDDYYALGSFGFNIIIYSVMLNWQGLTRGPLGLPGIVRPSIFGVILSDNTAFLILVIILAALVFTIAQLLVRSSFGRVLKAIREDEQAIQIFGYRTHTYKLFIFMVSAGMAAIAGALFATYITFIDPSSFVLMESIFILAIIILGGLANNKGALIGAIIMILLPEALRFVGFPTEIAAQMRQVVYGLLLILLMMYRPQGIIGEYKL